MAASLSGPSGSSSRRLGSTPCRGQDDDDDGDDGGAGGIDVPVGRILRTTYVHAIATYPCQKSAKSSQEAAGRTNRGSSPAA